MPKGCDHKFCRKCLKKEFESAGKPRCPKCKGISADSIPRRHKNKSWSVLKIRCQKEGCKKILKLEDFKRHRSGHKAEPIKIKQETVSQSVVRPGQTAIEINNHRAQSSTCSGCGSWQSIGHVCITELRAELSKKEAEIVQLRLENDRLKLNQISRAWSPDLLSMSQLYSFKGWKFKILENYSCWFMSEYFFIQINFDVEIYWKEDNKCFNGFGGISKIDKKDLKDVSFFRSMATEFSKKSCPTEIQRIQKSNYLLEDFD